MRISRTNLLFIAAAWIAGCAVGPDYHRPPALGTNALPAAFGDAAVTQASTNGNLPEWKTATPAAHLPRGSWWELFNDAELNRLEAMAGTNNQRLVTAVASFDQARALVGVARADFFPQVTGNGSLTRIRTSANTSPTSASAGRSRTFSQYSVTGDATWEPDLWGRVRRSVEAARDRFTASADDLESLRLSVQAEVASDYFSLRSLDAQSALLHTTDEAYARALELTKNRRRSGVASELDVAQAETQLRSARAQVPAVDLQRAQMRHALAVLCGEAATTFALHGDTVAATNVPAIPVSVPSEWLESRPDVAAAERQMAAANADVGVAKAAFYPRVTLGGTAGFQSVSAGTLFDWPSRFWSVGPTLQVPLFTGGRNRAQLAAARAAYEGAVGSYRQGVLEAFQDVEDQLAAQVLLARQLAEEQGALVAARRALEISNNRYKAGVEQYLDVITTQTAALAHEQSVIQLSGQRLVAAVGLIKAMGGGWKSDADAAQMARR